MGRRSNESLCPERSPCIWQGQRRSSARRHSCIVAWLRHPVERFFSEFAMLQIQARFTLSVWIRTSVRYGSVAMKVRRQRDGGRLREAVAAQPS